MLITVKTKLPPAFSIPYLLLNFIVCYINKTRFNLVFCEPSSFKEKLWEIPISIWIRTAFSYIQFCFRKMVLFHFAGSLILALAFNTHCMDMVAIAGNCSIGHSLDRYSAIHSIYENYNATPKSIAASFKVSHSPTTKQYGFID